MRNWTTLCAASLLAFSVACTDKADELEGMAESPYSSGDVSGQSGLVGISLSRASLDEFAESGVKDISIFVYMADSLIYGRSYPVGDGNIQMELPLGENLQTFAVANAGRIERTDSLSKTVVYLDELAQNEVYVSDVVGFTSDRSQPSLPLELKRMVGRAVLQPTDDAEDLASQTWFDRVEVTFTNIGTAYKVAEGKCVGQQDGTVSARKESGYVASVYSFPTESAGEEGETALPLTSVTLAYYLNNALANRTLGELKTNISFSASKSYNVLLPILEEGYLDKPLEKSRSAGLFSVVESEL